MKIAETERKPGRPGSSQTFHGLPWLVFIFVLATALLLAEGGLTTAGRLLIYNNPLDKVDADAIAILSGGGTPRLEEGARLYQNHLAPAIILTDTGYITPKYGSLSSIEKNQLVDMGVQPRDILITEVHVDSTADEARAIRKLLNTRGFKSVIIVTDTFHSMRTHLIFDDDFKGNDLTVYIHPLEDDWFNAATWWTSIAGWQTTLLEYSKLFAYLFTSRVMH